MIVSEADDQTLMALVAQGDEAAFRALAERHLGRMLRLAQKFLGSAAEADDVAQEALLRIWTHAGRYRPDRARLSTWIYTIVYRLCIDRLRTPTTIELEHAMDVEDPAPDAFDTLAGMRDLDRLHGALASLQPRQRAAIVLFYYEETSGPEAAAILGLGERAFWSLLHRARQTLQRHVLTPTNAIGTS